MWKRMLVVQLMFFFWFREIIFLLISLWLIFLCFFSDICNTETICMNVHVTSEENRNFSKNFARNFKKVFSLKIKIKVKKQLFFAFFWIFWTFNFKKKKCKKEEKCAREAFSKNSIFSSQMTCLATTIYVVLHISPKKRRNLNPKEINKIIKR